MIACFLVLVSITATQDVPRYLRVAANTQHHPIPAVEWFESTMSLIKPDVDIAEESVLSSRVKEAKALLSKQLNGSQLNCTLGEK
jgi:hypothetical protein